MAQIDEFNLDEQLERIASIACGAELGLLDDEIVDEDIKRMNATTRANKDRLKKLIKALIATQVQEARIDELEEAQGQLIEDTPSYIEDRLAQLRSTQ